MKIIFYQFCFRGNYEDLITFFKRQQSLSATEIKENISFWSLLFVQMRL